jgi:uncharacterized protein
MTTGQITNVDQLRAIYGFAKGPAASKVIDHVDEHAAAFIARSPFLLMATISESGQMDVSPKGETPGFVRVLDEETLAFPDRPGNNRIDGLQNIVSTGRIGLIFLVPGVRETLRVNGSAVITQDPALMSALMIDGKQPRTVTLITVEELFMHCARALIRSGLWDVETQTNADKVPSMGTILAAHTNGEVDACEYDEALPARILTNLY